MDEEAYKEIPDHLEGMKKYFDEILPICRNNFSECMKELGKSLLAHRNEVQFDIFDSMRVFHKAFGGCLKNARNTIGNLDHYILNGCEDLTFE